MIRGVWAKGIAIAALALCLTGGLAACGGGSSTASQQELAQAERHARLEKGEKEKERKLEREIEQLKNERLAEKKRDREAERHLTTAPNPPTSSSGTSPTPPESERTGCGGSLAVGPDTTCEFAENVEAEYFSEIGEGSGAIYAYSPANNENYEMFCTGSPHECTGAISAKVYFP